MDNIIFEERNKDLELLSFCMGKGVFAFCILEESMYVYHSEKEFETYFKDKKDKARYLKVLTKSLGFKKLDDLFIKTLLISEDNVEYEIYLCADKIVMANAYDDQHSKVLFDAGNKRTELLVKSSITELYELM